MKLVDEFRDEGWGVLIFDCEGVQRSVVLYEVKSAILLLDKEDQRCHGRFRGAYSATTEIFVDEHVHFGLFIGGEGVHLAA
jgi:hypothetical protein